MVDITPYFHWHPTCWKGPVIGGAIVFLNPWCIERIGVNSMVLDFKKNRAWADSLHILMQIGLTMVGCILFCLWVGIKLDQWVGTKGIFTTIFILLGIAGGGVTVYRQIVATMPSSQKKPDDPGDEA